MDYKQLTICLSRHRLQVAPHLSTAAILDMKYCIQRPVALASSLPPEPMQSEQTVSKSLLQFEIFCLTS